MTTAALVWAGITLAAGVLTLRSQQSPVSRPLPAAAALGGLFGTVAAAVGLGWQAQVLVVVVMSGGMAGLLLRWRALVAEDNLAPGVGGNRLLGRVGTVVTPVDPDGISGTVRLDTETWRATAAVDGVLHVGDSVTVVAVEGIHVVVAPTRPDRPVDDPPSPAATDPGGPLCA